MLISVYIGLNTVKQPSIFTDEVFKRQIVLEHVMEQVEDHILLVYTRSRTITNPEF